MASARKKTVLLLSDYKDPLIFPGE